MAKTENERFGAGRSADEAMNADIIIVSNLQPIDSLSGSSWLTENYPSESEKPPFSY
jgi:hypothetical protein